MLRALRSQQVNGTKVPGIADLNLWQDGFCTWNAERLGIPRAVAVERYRRSWDSFPGGHAGPEFRRFCLLQEDVFSVLADDSPDEVFDAYRLHSWLFLLRQICQPVPDWSDDDPVLSAFVEVDEPVFVDFGCGMAQTGISLALALRERGVEARLFLADLPTVRLEFIGWLCRHLGLAHEVAVCTPEVPVPELPLAHVAIAMEVFEHLHEPLPVLQCLHGALLPGGFLLTNVDDHEHEFMHVSPDLGPLRERLASLRYAELKPYVLFRKP